MLLYQVRAIRTMIKMKPTMKMKKQLLPQQPQRVLQQVQQLQQHPQQQPQQQLHLQPPQHYQLLNLVRL